MKKLIFVRILFLIFYSCKNMFNYIQKKQYNTDNTTGITRHYVPAIREWRNSVYSFNKNAVKDTALKDEQLYNTMWSLFLSKPFDKTKRSLRMRSLLRRNSSKRTFISKPGIKQTSDKNIVTIFFFDRESQLLKKRIYYLKKVLKKNNLLDNKLRLFGVLKSSFNHNFSSDIIKKIKIYEKKLELKKEVNILEETKKSVTSKKVLKDIKNKIKGLNKKMIKLSVNAIKEKKNKKVRKEKKVKKAFLTLAEKRKQKYLMYLKIKRKIKRTKINYNMLPKSIVPGLLKKRNVIRNMFLFLFLKSILKRFFNVNMKIFMLCLNCSNKGKNSYSKYKKNLICAKCKRVNTRSKSVRICFYKNNKLLSYTDLKPATTLNKSMKEAKITKLKVVKFKIININLSKILNRLVSNLSNKSLNTKTTEKWSILTNLFKKYKKLNYRRFILKCLTRELNTMRTLSNIHFSRFRYTDYTIIFKNFIKTLYNKKIELNLISLKYLHLDSDMFLDSLAIKLHKRKSRLFRVLRKSLSLIKRPKLFNALLEDKDTLSLESDLNKKLQFKIAQSVFNNKDNYVYNISRFDTRINILANLKYKWIAGVRLGAKGRLTRRYKASRALSKYVYRGNLKNLEHLYIPSYEKESVRVYRIRNQFKPNIQYTYKYGQRMIGTFGLKGWFNTM